MAQSLTLVQSRASQSLNIVISEASLQQICFEPLGHTGLIPNFTLQLVFLMRLPYMNWRAYKI